MKPAIVNLTRSGEAISYRIASLLEGEVHGLKYRVGDAPYVFEDLRAHLQQLFLAGRPIVAVMSSGIVIRLLAPILSQKHHEPPVIAVSPDGGSIVPLLGGHNGANAIAMILARALNAHAAITTASESLLKVALDEPPTGYRLVNSENVKRVTAELLSGESARIEGTADWIRESRIPLAQDGKVTLSVTEKQIRQSSLQLQFAPRSLALGLGCVRDCESAELIELAERALAAGGYSAAALAGVYSIDVKADEPAMQAVGTHFDVPVRFFSAAALEQMSSQLQNPSATVYAEVGCHGVSEGAALAAAGEHAVLVVPKIKSQHATAALAKADAPIDGANRGSPRGRLFVVGIGPGSAEWRSPDASRMIGEASDLVGYRLYLDLLGAAATGKIRHDFDLGAEEIRVRHAMELAGNGKNVALVCSGDAGIYAMATLVFELLENASISEAARRIAIEIAPGISALQAAAARAGAPLGHDFCTISLSDLLTPWEVICRRIDAAAKADFVIAFYNPVSRRRRTQLAHARDRLLGDRPPDTPVILATNLGRDGESVRIVPLHRLDVDDVDMLTVVIVGSSESRTIASGDGRKWVYTPRGYASKHERGGEDFKHIAGTGT